MIYYKATELGHKPFIQWESVANCFNELTFLGLDNDPLVLPEDKIPDFIFGVCPLEIVDGELHQVSCAQMRVYESEYNNYQLQIKLDKLLNELCSICCKIEVLKKIEEPYETLENEFEVKTKEYKSLKYQKTAEFLIPNKL
ncbi:MAG: hypothetical protein E2604_04220 [Flavobacterium sp.]|nr:hypothetical protein [Flavobacterium sp.]